MKAGSGRKGPKGKLTWGASKEKNGGGKGVAKSPEPAAAQLADMLGAASSPVKLGSAGSAISLR